MPHSLTFSGHMQEDQYVAAKISITIVLRMMASPAMAAGCTEILIRAAHAHSQDGSTPGYHQREVIITQPCKASTISNAGSPPALKTLLGSCSAAFLLLTHKVRTVLRIGDVHRFVPVELHFRCSSIVRTVREVASLHQGVE